MTHTIHKYLTAEGVERRLWERKKLGDYLVSENLSDTPKSWVEVGYDEADTTGMLVW